VEARMANQPDSAQNFVAQPSADTAQNISVAPRPSPVLGTEGNAVHVDFTSTQPDRLVMEPAADPESIYARMSAEAFGNLDGSRQEIALLDRMVARDWDSVKRFRPDFPGELTNAQRQMAYDVEEATVLDNSLYVNSVSPAYKSIERSLQNEQRVNLFTELTNTKNRRKAALEDPNIDPSHSLFLINYEAIGRMQKNKGDQTVTLEANHVFEPGVLYQALLERQAGIAPILPETKEKTPLQPDADSEVWFDADQPNETARDIFLPH
jgi:hypothetical protein